MAFSVAALYIRDEKRKEKGASRTLILIVGTICVLPSKTQQRSPRQSVHYFG